MPVTVTHAKSNVIADFTGTVTVGNSSGGTVTVQATDLVRPVDWNSAHQVTFALTGSEIASLFNIGRGLTSSTDASGISAGLQLDTVLEPYPYINTASSTLAAMGSWFVAPFHADGGMARGRIAFNATYASLNFLHGVVGSATNTGAASRTAAIRHMFAIYSQGTGANSTRIESYWTGECAISATNYITYSSTATNDCRVTNNITYGFISQIDSLGGTTSTTTSTGGSLLTAASTMASTSPNSLITATAISEWFAGSMQYQVPFNTTLPPGDYYLAHAFTTQSGTSTTGGGNYAAGTMFGSAPAYWFLTLGQQSAFKRLGYSNVANSTSVQMPYQGYLATAASTATAYMARTDIRNTTHRLYWNYIQRSEGAAV